MGNKLLTDVSDAVKEQAEGGTTKIIQQYKICCTSEVIGAI